MDANTRINRAQELIADVIEEATGESVDFVPAGTSVRNVAQMRKSFTGDVLLTTYGVDEEIHITRRHGRTVGDLADAIREADLGFYKIQVKRGPYVRIIL